MVLAEEDARLAAGEEDAGLPAAEEDAGLTPQRAQSLDRIHLRLTFTPFNSFSNSTLVPKDRTMSSFILISESRVVLVNRMSPSDDQVTFVDNDKDNESFAR